MSKYQEFQEKRKSLEREVIEASDFYYLKSIAEDYHDLLGKVLKELEAVEIDTEEYKEWRDFWNNHATRLNCSMTPRTYHLDTKFRLQKVIRVYDNKTHNLVEQTPIENPDEKKLIELGLYGLSEGGEYSIRTKDQIEYLSQYVDFCLDKCYYYWETDVVKVED